MRLDMLAVLNLGFDCDQFTRVQRSESVHACHYKDFRQRAEPKNARLRCQKIGRRR